MEGSAHRPDSAAQQARFAAFVSYSHADAEIARRLQRRLERFRIPRRLAERARSAEGAPRGKVGLVFRDREDLSAGEDLSAAVRDAIENSAALVVVCTPAAAQSLWVAREIELFRRLHPDRPVLAALFEGEPAEAFPPALVRNGAEPLAADFRRDRDGSRLAFLKIVAGILAVPLDELVQREAQARLRRVTAVTAVALAAMAVLLVMTILAIQSRREAERQRAEAEGLVEFMLTDLRDKLKGVGRLDVMDAVNGRAMMHYARQDLHDLPDDSLLRRSKLLRAMGEDNLNEGKFAGARGELEEAARTTGELFARKSDDTAIVFEHAQSEYWLGQLEFLQHDKPAARGFWNDYQRLATRLVGREPGKREWRRELGYSEANLCALALAKPAEPTSALDHCKKAAAIVEELAADTPGDLQANVDLMTGIAWLADAFLAAGQPDKALALRQRQQRLASEMVRAFPKDARATQSMLVAEIGLAKAQAMMGKTVDAQATAGRATGLARSLAKLDPANFRWRDWQNQIEHSLQQPIKNNN